MSRVGELWAALTDAEQDKVAAALRITLRDRGTQLVLAIAHEARPPEPVAASEPVDAYPYLLPEQAAGTRVERRCDQCRQVVRYELIPLWDFETSTLLMLGGGCWRDRMLDRERAEVPGDVQQAFPVPMPIADQEER